MKKVLVLFAVLMSCTLAQAQQIKISFICQGVHDGLIGNQMPRNPNDPPVVYLEDYTLTFEADHPEYVLYIKDEDEVVVYSTVVTSASTEVVLPSTLSGDYEIELIMGDWLFSGWIEL
jgi:hypothetical protein